MLRSLLTDICEHSLIDELAEVANICWSQMEAPGCGSKRAIQAQEELKALEEKVKRLIEAKHAVPTAEQIEAKNPPFCEGCEE